jgi:hypothetical protein
MEHLPVCPVLHCRIHIGRDNSLLGWAAGRTRSNSSTHPWPTSVTLAKSTSTVSESASSPSRLSTVQRTPDDVRRKISAAAFEVKKTPHRYAAAGL